MKISVIIPIFNVESFILECLNSVVKQDMGNSIEVLCIEDCSTDSSEKIVEEFISQNTNNTVKLIKHRINRGLSAARNTGIKHATGDYILFLDSDDMLVEGTMKKISDILCYQKVDILECGYLEIFDDKVNVIRNIVSKESELDGKILNGEEFFLKECEIGIYMPMSVIRIYSSAFLKNIHGFKEGILFEDEEFSPRTIMQAKSCMRINHEHYIYRRRENSITTSFNKNHRWINDYQIIINEQLKYLGNIRNIKCQEVLYDRIALLTLSILKNLVYYDTNNKTKKIAIDETKKNKLYKIPMKSKNRIIYFQGLLMKFPHVFMWVYRLLK